MGCGKRNPYDPPWHRRTDPAWLEQLSAARVSPADIDYVFCTHLHTDHVGWNTRQRDGRWVPTFPKAMGRVVAQGDAFRFRYVDAE